MQHSKSYGSKTDHFLMKNKSELHLSGKQKGFPENFSRVIAQAARLM